MTTPAIVYLAYCVISGAALYAVIRDLDLADRLLLIAALLLLNGLLGWALLGGK